MHSRPCTGHVTNAAPPRPQLLRAHTQLLCGLLELTSALQLPPPPRNMREALEVAVLSRGALSLASWQRVDAAYRSARVVPGGGMQVQLLTYL